jgi:copper chaperone NosL
MTSHRRLTALVLFTALAACQQAATAPPAAVEANAETTCSLDGMTLSDFPGPKAQMFLGNKATPDYFCDTIEMFAIYLKPEQARLVTALYVQDMAQADWRHPIGHWIDARTAFYVAGSHAKGSMGATLVSFAKEAEARTFMQQQGGTLYRFDQVTPDMVVLDGGVIKDRTMQ